MGRVKTAVFFLAALLSTGAAAQGRLQDSFPPQAGLQYFRISSGTGFFVNDAGVAITNEHVVHGCQRVYLQGNGFMDTDAEVRATDPQKDLALVFTSKAVRQTAPFRENIDDLKAGERVLVMGYPGTAGISGQYKVVESSVVDVHGPKDHPNWIQFEDAAQQGNSGGPLLDGSGNVIGVVVGKAQFFKVDKVTGEHTLIAKSDEAISLSTMKDFLAQNGVYFRGVGSMMQLDKHRIEDMARDFIINVQCRTPVDNITDAEGNSIKIIHLDNNGAVMPEPAQ
jgi:hypothetical protein